MRSKRTLLGSLGIAMFLVGTPVWSIAFFSLLLNAAADSWDTMPFSWSLFTAALAGLAATVGGVIVFQAAGRLENSVALNLR